MKLLVVRRDNIGDLVCATPLIAALRRRYPKAHLAALVNSYNAGVLAGNPDLDAVHVYTKLKHRSQGQSALALLRRRMRLLASLRRERFDWVLLAKAQFDRQGLRLAQWISPARVIGVAPPDGRREKAITDPVAPLPLADLHEVEVMMRLAAPLDVDGPPGPLRVFALPERVAYWRNRFPVLADGQWIAVHISAREPGRVWPAEKFTALIGSLDAKVVLLWSPGGPDNPRHPGDDARAAAIVAQTGSSGKVLPVKTESLEDLTAVLSLCRAFIGPDGGAMHLAAGLGLPVLALFENLPFKKHHWRPWQVPHQMVWPATRDVADIPIEAAIQAWQRLAH